VGYEPGPCPLKTTILTVCQAQSRLC
jgi:hypothetical protein